MTPLEAVIAHAAACRKALGDGKPRPRYDGPSLEGAYLGDANLRGANLEGADLTDADLTDADLTDAYLGGANLEGANLEGASLGGTILDPAAECPPCTDEQLRSASLEPRTVKGRQRVYGLRTERSIFVGDTHYTPKRWHKANALSVDSETECHPGIYLGGTEHATADRELVQAWCYRDECVFISAKKGVRARRIYVLGVHCG